MVCALGGATEPGSGVPAGIVDGALTSRCGAPALPSTTVPGCAPTPTSVRPLCGGDVGLAWRGTTVGSSGRRMMLTSDGFAAPPEFPEAGAEGAPPPARVLSCSLITFASEDEPHAHSRCVVVPK